MLSELRHTYAAYNGNISVVCRGIQCQYLILETWLWGEGSGWRQEVKRELVGTVSPAADDLRSSPFIPTHVQFLPQNHMTSGPHGIFITSSRNDPNCTNHKEWKKNPNVTFARCQDKVYLVHPSSSLPLCPVLPLSTLPPERPSTLTCSSSPLVWTRDCSQDARLQENETGMLFWLRPLRAGLLLHAG